MEIGQEFVMKICFDEKNQVVQSLYAKIIGKYLFPPHKAYYSIELIKGNLPKLKKQRAYGTEHRLVHACNDNYLFIPDVRTYEGYVTCPTPCVVNKLKPIDTQKK